jgi:hypothetical protein
MLGNGRGAMNCAQIRRWGPRHGQEGAMNCAPTRLPSNSTASGLQSPRWVQAANTRPGSRGP